MQQLLGGLIVGVLFGLGLLVSGLSSPIKVQQFLDLAGQWDPSLALVMVAAISVAFIPFHLAKTQRLTTQTGIAIQLPSNNTIDRSLLIGSSLFGIGWGLVGICPGPAVVLFGAGMGISWWFAPTMLLGMWSANRITAKY